jgi:GT2 family glycosyltransferase
MKKPLAPVALFVFNRPIHAKKTIEALKKNKESKNTELYIFSDGQKQEKDKLVEEVRRYIRTIKGFKKIKIIERKRNIGLAKSIITGIKEVFLKHEKIIVLEDDIKTSKYFLEFMNKSLDIYEKEKKVFGVTGYVYPTKKELPETFFIKLTNCWGWATWKDKWEYFEEDGKKLLKKIKSKRKFNIENTYPFHKMLKNQIKGKNNSWAIRWYASVFLENGVFLYPKKSLINNIGFDSEGTHCKNKNFFHTEISKTPIKVSKIKPIEDKFARKKFQRFFRSIFPKRLAQKIKKTLNIFS